MNVFTRRHEYPLTTYMGDFRDFTKRGRTCRSPRMKLTDICCEPGSSENQGDRNKVLGIKESRELREARTRIQLNKLETTNWTCGPTKIGDRKIMPDIKHDMRTTQRRDFPNPHDTPELVLKGDISCRPDLDAAEGIVPCMLVPPYGQIPSWYPKDYGQCMKRPSLS